MTPYKVRPERDDEGNLTYALILPKRAEPVGDIYREPLDETLWRGSAHVATVTGEEFSIAVVGKKLRTTARALYLAIRAVVRDDPHATPEPSPEGEE